jgi:hypothetical protein
MRGPKRPPNEPKRMKAGKAMEYAEWQGPYPNGKCYRCGRALYFMACSGCGWSQHLCKCRPLNEKKKCPACGRELPIGALYCPYCGAPLDDEHERYWRPPLHFSSMSKLPQMERW